MDDRAARRNDGAGGAAGRRAPEVVGRGRGANFGRLVTFIQHSAFSTQHCSHVLRNASRSPNRQEGHQGDRRLQPDRGRRPRDGRAVRRQGQLGADADPRRAAAARADRLLARRRHRRFRLRRLSPRPHLEDLRGARLGIPHRPHRDRRDDRGPPRRRRHAVLAVRAVAPRRALPARDRSRRDQDRARPSPRRLHRDAAAQSVLRRRAQGDAGAARLRQRRARRHPSARRRHRVGGAQLRQGVGAADHRLLLPGLRRPEPAAAAHQAAHRRARGRASRDQELDDSRARQRRHPPPARSPAAPGAGAGPHRQRKAATMGRCRCGWSCAEPCDDSPRAIDEATRSRYSCLYSGSPRPPRRSSGRSSPRIRKRSAPATSSSRAASNHCRTLSIRPRA